MREPLPSGNVRPCGKAGPHLRGHAAVWLPLRSLLHGDAASAIAVAVAAADAPSAIATSACSTASIAVAARRVPRRLPRRHVRCDEGRGLVR